jgi:hypothetical protein
MSEIVVKGTGQPVRFATLSTFTDWNSQRGDKYEWSSVELGEGPAFIRSILQNTGFLLACSAYYVVICSISSYINTNIMPSISTKFQQIRSCTTTLLSSYLGPSSSPTELQACANYRNVIKIRSFETLDGVPSAESPVIFGPRLVANYDILYSLRDLSLCDLSSEG